jgi:Big-like domain-containing protein
MRPKNETRKQNATVAPRRIFGVGMFGASLALAALALPQNQPSLQISSPSNGAVVAAGQTLSITVTSPTGLSFQMVALIGPDPIGFNTSGTSMPAQFSIPIPPDADCGIYNLTADGLTQSGQSVTSAPIQIDIERSDLPAALSTLDSSSVVLESMGEQVHSTVLAHFADGSIADVTRSTLVSFASSDTAVATVDSSGAITAQSAGSAMINVTYTLGSQSLQIPIPVTVKTPKLTVSPSSLTFTAQAIGSSSQPQQLTITNATTDPITVLSVAAKGDFSEIDNCVASSPLDAGGTCTASVFFSPLLVGARPGALSIANSANNAPIDVTLTGTGTAPPPPNITRRVASRFMRGTSTVGFDFGGAAPFVLGHGFCAPDDPAELRVLTFSVHYLNFVLTAGFSPATLLDCCDVPLQVINLLNTPVTDPTFNPTNP